MTRALLRLLGTLAVVLLAQAALLIRQKDSPTERLTTKLQMFER